MRLLEYEAKNLLSTYRIPIPRGKIFAINELQNITTPVVLKSQIPVGGRGKLGGVRIIRQQTEIQPIAQAIFNLKIRGFLPNKLLAEEILNIDREFYFSLIINRETAAIELLAHAKGGVEIESQDTADFFRRDIVNEKFEALADELADYLDIADKTFLLQDIIENAYRCFIDNDCLLLEINPLILTSDGRLIASDAKITVDDAAAFRHLDWQFEDNSTEHNFVILNRDGAVATIANGAGLAMATVDAVAASGLVPANFLDIGGTATSDKVLDCFRQITTLDNIKVIIINIFGGIVRCDEVARAIIDAQRQIPNLPKLAIRLSGNREAEARQLLAQYNLPLFDSLEAILEDIS
jgi:succinyl-coA ligase [ADP-forming] subunit beta